MSEMIERVARAQFANAYAVDPGPSDKWEAMSPAEQKLWLDAARVAIEAMRDPTEAMRQVGKVWPTAADDYEGDPVIDNLFAVERYRAMIDAALNAERPPTPGMSGAPA